MQFIKLLTKFVKLTKGIEYKGGNKTCGLCGIRFQEGIVIYNTKATLF